MDKANRNFSVRWACALRLVELLVLFVGAPTGFWFWRIHPERVVSIADSMGLSMPWLGKPGHLMLPTLAAFTAGCLFVLLRDATFVRKRLWNVSGLRNFWRPILLRFVVLAALLTALVWQLEPGQGLRIVLDGAGFGQDWPVVQLFSLPQQRPGLWILIMFAYPLISVWPQEVLYRAFFFHRYEMLLNRAWARIFVSAFVFGYMHIVFMNPVAPILCSLGGLLFATTYERTHSVVAASFEHALYGCWIFTVGLGAYFYGGTYGGTLGS